jgi:hypothetical protein
MFSRKSGSKSDKWSSLGYKSFDDYCKSKWNMSRTFVFNTIESSKVAKRLNVLNCEHSPQTESQARPLTKLAPEQQPVAVEKAGGEQPTAKQVEEARLFPRAISLCVMGPLAKELQKESSHRVAVPTPPRSPELVNTSGEEKEP